MTYASHYKNAIYSFFKYAKLKTTQRECDVFF